MNTVLFYINAINGGGAERVMVNLANQFSGCSYNVLLVTSYCAEGEYKLGETVKRLSLENIEIKQSRFMRNLSRIQKLRRICKKEKPDIVVTFMSESNFRGLIATKGLKVKNIISVRNVPEREYAGRIRTIVAKHLLPCSDGCVFQTEDAKRWFPKKLRDKSMVIPNAVNPAFYGVKRTPVEKRIVSCGRLTAQKNQALLIQAFAKAEKNIPGAQLFIYGQGELENALKQLVRELGMSGKVFLKGQTNDVAAAIKCADLFVLSSDYEGMPNALMEAMAVGIPCISTDCPCGGPKELIRDGVDGLLVPVGDEKKMGEAMLRVLSDKKFKETMGMNASIRAQMFEPGRIFGEWKNYIDRIIGK